MRHRTSLGADDAGRDGGPELVAKRTADSQNPLTEPQLVGIPERKRRKSLSVNLYQSDIRSRVSTDDLGVIYLVVIQGDLYLRRVGDHVVVGHDVAVRTDDHSRAASLLLPGLRAFIPEEETEERIRHLILLSHRHLHINNSINRSLRGVSQIRIVRLCQIDSLCDCSVLCSCHIVSLIHGGRLDDTVCRQHAEQY